VVVGVVGVVVAAGGLVVAAGGVVVPEVYPLPLPPPQAVSESASAEKHSSRDRGGKHRLNNVPEFIMSLFVLTQACLTIEARRSNPGGI
jgi:hypothetical protein